MKKLTKTELQKLKTSIEKEFEEGVFKVEQLDGYVNFRDTKNKMWYGRITKTGRLKKHSIRIDI